MLFLLWCTAVSALDRDGSIRDLRHTAWGPQQGAPDAISALAQTTDGYLWVGNAAGLFRFDGMAFERISLDLGDRLSSANVFSLYAPASGGLWIGFSFGGIAFVKDGQTLTYSWQDGLPKGSITSIAQDLDGTVWVSTATGLAKRQGSRWQKVGAEAHYTDPDPQALLVDSAGTLWVGSNSKVLQLRRGEALFREVIARPYLPMELGMSIAESPSGTVWLLRADELQPIHQNDAPRRPTASTGMSLLFDRDGSLWTVDSKSQLRRFAHPERIVAPVALRTSNSSDAFSSADGRSSDGGSGALIEDREGNVWVSSAGGLDRFSQRNVNSIPSTQIKQLQGFDPVDTVIAPGDGGGLWLSGTRLPAHHLQDGGVQRHDNINSASCAIRTDDGTLWFGGFEGLWKYTSGRIELTKLPEGNKNWVQAMTADRAGGLWVSIVRQGVHRLDNGVWSAWGDLPSLPRWTALTLATDATGRVWFGYPEGRMAVLEGADVRVFSGPTRLPVGNVMAIHARRAGVWAGGEFGLARFDGNRFQAVTAEAKEAFSNITGIVETADGDLWLNSGAGIVRVAASELRRAALDTSHRVRVEVFGVLDGVQGSSARLRPLPTAIEGTDGRLWFARNVDVYSITPARIFRNPVPPPVLIQSLSTDDKAYTSAVGLTLPQRTTSVRIDYVGLSLTIAEKIRYRYKLDGVDHGWQDAQARRQAFYTNLGPGSYRFQVVAANNDGVWNDTGASLSFTIQPAFVQTGWFVALCLAAGGLALWWCVRVRIRQVTARMRASHADRTAERERIARELHDTLLQGTQGLILQFQAAANDIAEGNPTRDKLEKALDRADALMAEGRDRVMDLRVPADAMRDLPEAFAAAGSELAQGRSVAFRTVAEGTPRELVRHVQDEAYSIGREALINAFRHAEAQCIEVQLIHAQEGFRIRVRDDGRGIDPDALEAGSRPRHWGLPGMRERAQQIGAKLDIWSRPGAGTEIELRIPAAVAYRRPASSRGWLRRWRIPGT